jgi:DNA-binding CsgD family transcriptional regulator/tetratricopeptide (TPR) repeat protein
MARGSGSVGCLIGREDELTWLSSRLEAGTSALVRGEAGIGKSALLAAALAGRDADVCLRGVHVLRETPYLPLRVAIPNGVFDAAPVDVADRLDALDAACFVVDDLHWCDADTLAVLAELALRRPVVATVRTESGPAADVVAVLTMVGDVLDLGPLAPDAATTLVRRLRPAATDADVVRCVRSAAGNALDLHLLALGGSTAVDAHQVARLAVADLDPPLLELLAELAISGPARVDPARRDALVARGLAVVEPDGLCRPRHDLVADAAVDAAGEAVRRRLHARAAANADDDASAAVHYAAAHEHAAAVAAAGRAAACAPTVWSHAEFLRIVADHTVPPSADANRDAASALSLAGRYQEAIELLGPAPPDEPADVALIRARGQWALTAIDPAREAIESALAQPSVAPSTAAELYALRSRIRCRVDWDLPGAIADARTGVALAADAQGALAAQSALGLALLMSGDPGWQQALEEAGRLAVGERDVHNAVTVYDTTFFAHLLSGDPARCLPLAAEVIELTERSSTAWNGYFRCISLLAKLHVEGDHDAVLRESAYLRQQRLTVKSAEAARTARVFALTDSGEALDAVELAEEALRVASDASARSMASWALADAAWLSGNTERAVEVATAALDLGLDGFPGVVNAALMCVQAQRDLGLPVDERALAAVRSPFANLAAAGLEADGLVATTPAEACAAFERASDAWTRTSVRSALRSRWAAGVAAAEAGDIDRARTHLRAVEQDAVRYRIDWLDRRAGAALRAVGLPREHTLERNRSTAPEVLARIARGQRSIAIARSLGIGTATVETHVRNAMRRTGARTRLQAAALTMVEAADPASSRLVARRRPDGSLVIRSEGLLPDADRTSWEDLPASPWRLASSVVVGGTVHSEEDLTAAVLAFLRGARVDVEVPPGQAATAGLLVDALDRVSDGVTVEAGAADWQLSDDDRRLVALLAGGYTVTDAARSLAWSRRTIQRRLERIRLELGVATTDEAVMLAARPRAAAS